jgi:hypothetical protein
MGLDQYLYARKYVSANNFNRDEEGNFSATPNSEFSNIMEQSGLPLDINKYTFAGSANVAIQVGYWRKANAIHGWFVNTLGGGVDECQEIYVPRNALVDLREACKSVLSVSAGVSMKDMADEVGLTPTEGFFFGSYEMDEWYMDDLKTTIEMIDFILVNTSEDYDFFYQASW